MGYGYDYGLFPSREGSVDIVWVWLDDKWKLQRKDDTVQYAISISMNRFVQNSDSLGQAHEFTHNEERH